MNNKFKAKWIKALRSGEYAQARGQLRCGTRGAYEYCCLGVARLVLNQKARFGAAGYLNRNELKAIGITSEQQETLINKNDNDHWSFKKIADYIEKNL